MTGSKVTKYWVLMDSSQNQNSLKDLFGSNEGSLLYSFRIRSLLGTSVRLSDEVCITWWFTGPACCRALSHDRFPFALFQTNEKEWRFVNFLDTQLRLTTLTILMDLRRCTIRIYQSSRLKVKKSVYEYIWNLNLV